MATIVSGLVGGLIAAIVMAIVMRVLSDDPPPPAAVWAKYIGNGPPADYMMPGMVVHLIYGTVSGGVFVAIAGALGFISLVTIGGGLLWGIVWSVLLFIGAAVFWMMIVLGMQPDRQQGIGMLVMHLAYGVTLGLWVFFVPTF